MADERIPIALIPTRQPLVVVAALTKLLGAVLGEGAAMAPGNNRDVASTLISSDTDPDALALRLLSAAARLGADVDPDELIALPERAVDAEPAPQMVIGHQAPDEDGGVTLSFSTTEEEHAGLMAQRMMAAFLPAARKLGVDNYIEYEGFDSETGQRVLLTFVVPGGKRPAELRREAEAERDALQAQLDALSGAHKQTRGVLEDPDPTDLYVGAEKPWYVRVSDGEVHHTTQASPVLIDWTGDGRMLGVEMFSEREPTATKDIDDLDVRAMRDRLDLKEEA